MKHKYNKIVLLIMILLMSILCGCENKQDGAADISAQNDSSIKIVQGDTSSWPNTCHFDYPLSVSDNDYLVLVNKTHPVTSNFYPDDMIKIDRFVEGIGSDETHQLKKEAADALNRMFDDAEKEGLVIRLRTGFRSYGYQASLFSSYAAANGEESANKFSAKPGQSEHQTGLAADLAAESQGFVLSNAFGDSPEGKWVKANCYKYGFILRYTDGTPTKIGEHTGYIYEAWHVRYVGIKVAEIMRIYPEWTLEQYLEKISGR